MGFDADGNLYLLDRGGTGVIVIDGGGNLAMTVGRKGEGPEEFRTPTDIVVWRDGRFGVVDFGHAAYQLFTPDGQLERFVGMSSAAGEAGMGAARSSVRADPTGGAVIAEGVGFGAMLASVFMEESGGERIDIVGEEGKLERLNLRGDVAVADSIARARRIPPDREDVLTFAPSVIWGRVARWNHRLHRLHRLRDQSGRAGRENEGSAGTSTLAGKGCRRDSLGGDRARNGANGRGTRGTERANGRPVRGAVHRRNVG